MHEPAEIPTMLTRHNTRVKTSTPKHKWTFRARFRSCAFGWKASHLACKRLKEAVAEIKKVAKEPLHSP